MRNVANFNTRSTCSSIFCPFAGVQLYRFSQVRVTKKTDKFKTRIRSKHSPALLTGYINFTEVCIPCFSTTTPEKTWKKTGPFFGRIPLKAVKNDVPSKMATSKHCLSRWEGLPKKEMSTGDKHSPVSKGINKN